MVGRFDAPHRYGDIRLYDDNDGTIWSHNRGYIGTCGCSYGEDSTRRQIWLGAARRVL